jgi:hypothetical protein
MTIEPAKDVNGIRYKLRKSKKAIKLIDCDSVKALPESTNQAGFSKCEVRILHRYIFSKKIPLSPTEIINYLIGENKYDGKRKNCFRENLEILFNHYRTEHSVLGDFEEMKVFSQSLSPEQRI